MTDRALGILHPGYIHMLRDGQLLYGCDQDWYQIEWRRRAGCGPVAATNILLYLRKKYGERAIPYDNGDINDINDVNDDNGDVNDVNDGIGRGIGRGVAGALEAMNDVFRFVRPGRRGLHTVKNFVRGMGKFGRRYGLSLRYRYITVPPQNDMRPDLGEIARFIEEGLSRDVPVAFLNLDAGEVEEQLSSWHWVTVVGMSIQDGAVTLRFYDQSKELNVDLARWLDTTAMGGGFVYFCEPSPRYAKGAGITYA